MVKKIQFDFKVALEGLVIGVIALALFQALIQDLGDLLQWRWSIRKALIYIGLFFDIFFSIEFITRLFFSLIARKPIAYLRDRHGWVDFVASIPLLIFSSGPAAFSAYNNVSTVATAAGVFGVLKIIKAIRIARVLRLLRLLKIFKHIKHVDSRMAQRHLTRVATIIVSTVVLTLIGFSFISVALDFPNLENSFEEHTRIALEERVSADMTSEDIAIITELRPDVLIIKKNNDTLYSRVDNTFYRTYYGPSDYAIASFPEYNIDVYIDLLPLVSNTARQDILHFMLIVALILVVLFLYGPHFAATISDPAQVMSRGLHEKGHSLQVVIPSRHKDDEIYRLASGYNDVFLPLKDRVGGSAVTDGSVVDISLDDVKKFIDE